MQEIPGIGKLEGIPEFPQSRARVADSGGGGFAEALKDAVRTVDELQRGSESAQADLAAGKPVELHEVLIQVEEAEIAFRTMMSVRNKLVDAYREIMRLGSGG